RFEVGIAFQARTDPGSIRHMPPLSQESGVGSYPLYLPPMPAASASPTSSSGRGAARWRTALDPSPRGPLVAPCPRLEDRVGRVGPGRWDARLAPEADQGPLERLELHPVPRHEVVPERGSLVVGLGQHELVLPVDQVVAQRYADGAAERTGLDHDRAEHR